MLDDHEQLEMPAQVVGDASGRAQPGAQPTPKVMDRSPQAGVQPKRDPRRRFLVAIAALLALGTGTYFGASWWTTGRYMVSTDDAYVGARNSTLSPKVSGYVSDVAVEDNAQVKASDVIVRIADGDYRLAVQTARDQIAVQQATIQRFARQITAQQAVVEQAKAQLASAKGGERRPDLELKRQQDL